MLPLKREKYIFHDFFIMYNFMLNREEIPFFVSHSSLGSPVGELSSEARLKGFETPLAHSVRHFP